MGVIELLETLQAFTLEHTKDLLLPVNVTPGSKEPKERQAAVYICGVPRMKPTAGLPPAGTPMNGTPPPTDNPPEIQQIPYVLIKYVKSTDTQDAGEKRHTAAMLRFIFAVYGEDEAAGVLHLLNLVTRVRQALLETTLIAKRYELQLPLEAYNYQDNTQPYYLGEMMAGFTMPPITRKVEILWQK